MASQAYGQGNGQACRNIFGSMNGTIRGIHCTGNALATTNILVAYGPDAHMQGYKAIQPAQQQCERYSPFPPSPQKFLFGVNHGGLACASPTKYAHLFAHMVRQQSCTAELAGISEFCIGPEFSCNALSGRVLWAPCNTCFPCPEHTALGYPASDACKQHGLRKLSQQYVIVAESEQPISGMRQCTANQHGMGYVETGMLALNILLLSHRMHAGSLAGAQV
jgi:hypothetical protein